MSIKTLSKIPKCKRCDRTPSLMGKEPMYLAPYGSKYYVLCGGCQAKLLYALSIEATLSIADLSNLYTHVDRYHEFVRIFLRITK